MSLRVDVVACLVDNYAYVIVGDGGRCVVVDPSDDGPIAAHLDAHGLKPEALWVTHHHADHTSGIAGLKKKYRGIDVVGFEADAQRIDGLTVKVRAGQRIEHAGVTAEIMHVPGHTLGAIGFLVFESGRPRCLFTGDTLFGAGCGRLFEGTADMMHRSLSLLASVGDDVLVYPGHEYTEKNLRFAAELAPNQAVYERLDRVVALRAQGLPSVPFSMGVERETNPFLRAASVQAFAELRRRRDVY